MSGLKHLGEIAKRGKEFINKLLSEPVEISEDLDGTRIIITKTNGVVGVFRKNTSTPLTYVDRVIMNYYEPVFKYLESNNVINIPDNSRLGFQYFYNTKPNHIKYEKMPKNHLVLTDAVIDGEQVTSKKELDEIADQIQVDKAPIYFLGMIPEKVKASIMEFLYDKETNDFIGFLMNKLVDKNTTPLLSTDWSNVACLVFRFNDNKTLAKIVNPMVEEIKAENKPTKRKPNDIYALTIIELTQFIAGENLSNIKINSTSADKRYVELMTTLFKKFIGHYGNRYKYVDFMQPDFLKKDQFDIDNNIIDKDLAEMFILSPSYKELYKIMLSSYRKTKKKPYGIITKEFIKSFNQVVKKIKDIVEEKVEEFMSFSSYFIYDSAQLDGTTIFSDNQKLTSFITEEQLKSEIVDEAEDQVSTSGENSNDNLQQAGDTKENVDDEEDEDTAEKEEDSVEKSSEKTEPAVEEEPKKQINTTVYQKDLYDILGSNGPKPLIKKQGGVKSVNILVFDQDFWSNMWQEQLDAISTKDKKVLIVIDTSIERVLDLVETKQQIAISTGSYDVQIVEFDATLPFNILDGIEFNASEIYVPEELQEDYDISTRDTYIYGRVKSIPVMNQDGIKQSLINGDISLFKKSVPTAIVSLFDSFRRTIAKKIEQQ